MFLRSCSSLFLGFNSCLRGARFYQTTRKSCFATLSDQGEHQPPTATTKPKKRASSPKMIKKTTSSGKSDPSSYTSIPSSSQSTVSSQQEKPKKQLSLAGFFTGVKPPKTAPQSETQTKINTELGNGVWPNKDTVKIACWNINGIRAVLKRGDLQSYIKTGELDILCLNETKIDELSFIKEKLSQEITGNYTHYWNFCIPPIKGYSGVAILSKEKAIRVKQGIDVEAHSQEGRVLTAEFEKFFIVVVYVPNAGSGLSRLDYRVNQFDKDFQAYLNNLQDQNPEKPVILCGDLNVAHNKIDLTNPEDNKGNPGFTDEERVSFSTFLQSGWTDTFRFLYPKEIKYSWWSNRMNCRDRNVGWRIDYFVIRNKFRNWVKDSMINNRVFGSDHCPVELILDLTKAAQTESAKVDEQQQLQESKEQEQAKVDENQQNINTSSSGNNNDNDNKQSS